MNPLTKTEVTAYLNRIGVTDVEAPTKAYLFELHKAHVKNLSWQTVDIFGRKPAAIDRKQSVQLILNGRSGYCFHLNGAFSLLLQSLGYKVSMHRAGVQPMGAEPCINSFHLGLTVSLRNEQLEEEKWIIDAGLGDLPFEPLPLRFGTYLQAPYSYKVTGSSIASNGWRIEHDSLASFVGVDFDPAVVLDMEEFIPKHEHYSRSTASPWFDVFLIRNRNETEGHELRGCVWKKRVQSGIVKTEIQNQSQWLEVLADIFGEKLVNYSSLERDELWKRAWQAHLEWKRINLSTT